MLFLMSMCLLHAEESFIVMQGQDCLKQLGDRIEERASPCSTFKIALSLMGFDAGILVDEENPVWDYQEGYDDYLPSWKAPQSPRTWMKLSCVWYSRLLAQELGLAAMEHYLSRFNYGNQDFSGGLTKAWIKSTLLISPKEQVLFIQKLLQGELPISLESQEKTKNILFHEILPNDWKLFGKTGSDGQQLGWFVGWVEKEGETMIFAYQNREPNINLAARIPRVKELLKDLYN